MTEQAANTRVLQRVVFPLDPDQDTLCLYAEGSQPPTALRDKHDELLPAPAAKQDTAQVMSRRTYAVKPKSRTSFGTYFNAFPASYWRKWTILGEVRLTATVSGSGSLFVYRSNARGNVFRVESVRFTDACSLPLSFNLSLSRFADGGWYWFDIVAGSAGATLEHAQWEGDSTRPQGTVTVGVTTLDRPEDVVALLNQYAAEPDLLSILDRVTIVDQGKKHPEDVEGFEAAQSKLGGRLRMIRQGNAGGSGGFSRGMIETLDEGLSDYHLISDDDVRIEPEAVRRAVTFADLARRPTIVGGQMFSMYDRPHLQVMGERVQMWRFRWGPVLPDFPAGHHLNQESLRSTPALHRRIDVDYNGWWMTLVPVGVIRELGLSLPLFIKWDDAEFGLRARKANIPTVTLPGVAVWHVPWTDKDDTLDWQAYYHERNWLVVGLIHSPFPRGGRMARESLYINIKHLLAGQYSAVELRNQALEDVMSGPDHLHRDLLTRLGRIRQTRSQYADARIEHEPDAYPPIRRSKVSKKDVSVTVPKTVIGRWAAAGVGVVKSFLPIRPMSVDYPEAEIAAMDAKWVVLSHFDSALVSASDGSGAMWYKRSRRQFLRLLRNSFSLHSKMLKSWASLAQAYQADARHLVSQDAWRRTLGVDAAQPQPQSVGGE